MIIIVMNKYFLNIAYSFVMVNEVKNDRLIVYRLFFTSLIYYLLFTPKHIN